MVQAVDAWLLLPDGRIALQRRDAHARVSAGLLNPFGGLIEANEKPEEAMQRELKEETSLPVDEMDIKFLFRVEAVINQRQCELFVFQAYIESLDFKVFEGEHAEAYSIEELKRRNDTSPSTKAILEKLGSNNE